MTVDEPRTLDDLIRYIGCDPDTCSGSHGSSGPIGWRHKPGCKPDKRGECGSTDAGFCGGELDGRYRFQHTTRPIIDAEITIGDRREAVRWTIATYRARRARALSGQMSLAL